MKICIIGAFGFNMIEKTTGGQPVKTRQLFHTLASHYGDSHVTYIETYGWKSHPIRMFLDIFKQAKNCDVMIMLPAHNGVQIFSRLLTYCKKRYNIKIFYDVIGGWLPEKTKDDIALKKQLMRFNGIWVETQNMKSALDSQGFANISVVPNFRKMKVLKSSELVFPQGYPLRMCTFSRVMKQKGIETAIDTVIDINNQLGYNAISLDIYGPVDPADEEWFGIVKEKFTNNISYRGCVRPEDSCNVLKDYFCLLFPTYYHGEGFAGTILDALAAGVPIVASDWHYNAEIVTEDVGYIYPTHDQNGLAQILKHVAINRGEVLAKKIKCLEKASLYTEEYMLNTLARLLE